MTHRYLNPSQLLRSSAYSIFAVVVESLSRVGLFCNSMDCSPPGSSVHGISQARILGWVAISISRDLPKPGTESMSLALQVDSLPLRHHIDR